MRVRKRHQAGGHSHCFSFSITDLFYLKLTYLSQELSKTILLVYTFKHCDHGLRVIITLHQCYPKIRVTLFCILMEPATWAFLHNIWHSNWWCFGCWNERDWRSWCTESAGSFPGSPWWSWWKSWEGEQWFWKNNFLKYKKFDVRQMCSSEKIQ